MYCITDRRLFSIFTPEEIEERGMKIKPTNHFVCFEKKVYRVYEGTNFHSYVEIDKILQKRGRFLCDYLIGKDQAAKEHLEEKMGKEISSIEVSFCA